MSLESVICNESWSGIINKISDKEKKGFRIKEFVYGDGGYRVAMREDLYNTQSVIHVESISDVEKEINKFWDKHFHLTNIVYDGHGFALVFSFSMCTRLTGQVYFVSSDFRGLRDKISSYWDRDYRITSITSGYGKYLCVMSEDNVGLEQTMRFYPEGLSKSDIHNLFDEAGEDFIVTGVYSVYNGVIVVYTAKRAVYPRETICQSSNWDYILDSLKNGWEDQLQIEAFAYYDGWILLMSGEERMDMNDDDDDEDDDEDDDGSLW